MKLYDRFGAKGFHSSFITTFGIDFDTYENVCLSRLRGAGCTNNFILPDARMQTYALDGASVLPRYAGRFYSAVGMAAPRGGVFHSKLYLRIGRRTAELLIGSANMTAPGLAGNRELMGMVESGPEASGERRIIAAAWSYLEPRLDQTQNSVVRQIAWMRARSSWLLDTEPAAGLTSLGDGSGAAFLTNSGELGIGRQFMELIDERPVTRLIVISPYWEPALSALKMLIGQLKPAETILLIEPDRGLFPSQPLTQLPDVILRNIGVLDKTRFFHAKAVIAQTSNADHVLFGSANCTSAALGSLAAVGINEEACLYRRLPPQASIGALGLEAFLTPEHEIDRGTIAPQEPEDDLPLTELAKRNPGRFECIYDTLIWWPPDGVTGDAAIELLDAEGNPANMTITTIPSESPGTKRFRLTGSADRPALARLRYEDSTVSTLAIIALADALRLGTKEARGKKAEEAAAQLAEETNEGFWLLETLDILEAAEERQHDDASTITRKRRNKDKPEPPQSQHHTLDYERFIAGRHLRSDHSTFSRTVLPEANSRWCADF